MNHSNIVIVSAARTAIGSFNSTLSQTTAPQLGAFAIKEAVARAGLKNDQISEVIMGNVLAAGLGQAPARQAAIFAGLANSTPTTTINKMCGSGLKAVMLGAQALMVGDADVVVAGGQENMSLAPHLLEKSRAGYKMGHVSLTDSMIKDGLWDVYNNFHMGSAAELCAKEKHISREEQDAFAIESYKRAQTAVREGYFKEEIVSVSVTPPGSRDAVMFSEDEEPFKVKFDKVPSLKPVFDKQGSVTAANASTINDGACALVLTTEEKAKALGLKPLAKIIGQASAAQAPEWFSTAPAKAMHQVLKKTNLTIKDMDLFEINEAFSVVTLAAVKEFNLDQSRVNVHGGAVALGHPIGASGARILTTLIHAMQKQKVKRGMASICIGGGEASAVIVERV